MLNFNKFEVYYITEWIGLFGVNSKASSREFYSLTSFLFGEK